VPCYADKNYTLQLPSILQLILVRCARCGISLCGAVIISRRGAVFCDAVRTVRAVRYFVTRAVSKPRAVCAVRFFVTP